MFVGESRTQYILAQWAKNQYRLQKVPNQATVSRILSSSICMPNVLPHLLKFKMKRKCDDLLLEPALYNWMSAKIANNVQTNGTNVL